MAGGGCSHCEVDSQTARTAGKLHRQPASQPRRVLESEKAGVEQLSWPPLQNEERQKGEAERMTDY